MLYLFLLLTAKLITRNKGGQRPGKKRKQRRMAISNNETAMITKFLTNILDAPCSQLYWKSSCRKSRVLL